MERGSVRRSSLTREGHRQSHKHCKCFKGNSWETSDRRCGVHVGFPERIDTTLSLTKRQNVLRLQIPNLSEAGVCIKRALRIVRLLNLKQSHTSHINVLSQVSSTQIISKYTESLHVSRSVQAFHLQGKKSFPSRKLKIKA